MSSDANSRFTELLTFFERNIEQMETKIRTLEGGVRDGMSSNTGKFSGVKRFL